MPGPVLLALFQVLYFYNTVRAQRPRAALFEWGR
jgi:hypothetical protein